MIDGGAVSHLNRVVSVAALATGVSLVLNHACAQSPPIPYDGFPGLFLAAPSRGLELPSASRAFPPYHPAQGSTPALTAAAQNLGPLPLAQQRPPALAIWDGGALDRSWPDFSPISDLRLADRTPPALEEHASNVAALILGAGGRSPLQGISRVAGVWSLDFKNVDAEIAELAAASPFPTNGPVFISNHSYSIVCGWDTVPGPDGVPIGAWFGPAPQLGTPCVDDKFGRYAEATANLDALAWAHPFWLPVFAAGNDRARLRLDPNSNLWIPALHSTPGPVHPELMPPDDGEVKRGFDTLPPHQCAKNALVVGSCTPALDRQGRRVSRRARSAEHSSWGPTDDGRIKPDLVAQGTLVPYVNGRFVVSANGTSLAAPAVAACALAISDFYAVRHGGARPPAALLRAILIHSANDLLVPGPDFRTGWGLVNAEAATSIVAKIANDGRIDRPFESAKVLELTESQPEVILPFNRVPGATTKVTLAWTDPPGAVVRRHDDSQSVLVHDLDLSVFDTLGVEHLPLCHPYARDFQLQRTRGKAKPGVNSRDNVEQVRIPSSTPPGRCWIRVRWRNPHSGAAQSFAVVGS